MATWSLRRSSYAFGAFSLNPKPLNPKQGDPVSPAPKHKSFIIPTQIPKKLTSCTSVLLRTPVRNIWVSGWGLRVYDMVLNVELSAQKLGIAKHGTSCNPPQNPKP